MANPTITTIYGTDANGVWYTTPLNWIPGAPPAVVVPPIIPPVVTPPAGAVVMPKVNYHYPASATLVAPGGNIQAALAKGPVRLGKGSYSGTVTMFSGWHLYGMGGEMSDCSGLTINIPDSVTGCIISGLFGAKINVTGNVKANVFRRNKWCDINVQSGTFESNLIYGFEAALNINNAVWKNNRVVGQTRHSSEAGVYDTTIQSPAGRASVGNVFLWRTFQSLPKAMLVQGQGDLTIVGLDVEQSPTIMEASDNGTIRTAVLNGGGNSNSGFTIAGDELDIIGGSFGAPGPTVISNGLKRLYMAYIAPDKSGSVDAIYNETSPAALLAPILNPVRTGSAWERPSLPTPPNPTVNVGAADTTATVQAVINGNGFLPAGTYVMTGTVTMKPGQFLIGAGDGQTVIVCTKGQDAFKWSGGGTTCAFHISDLTIIGARYGVYANTAGDQLNSCTISHVTFRNCAAGICAQNIYGVDNNFFDYLNFVSCTTGVLQLPDPNYTGGETPTMTYFDKTVFYACQFIGCTKGADMQAIDRPNNLDAFLCSIFKDCGSVGTFLNNYALLFAQCDMLNSGILHADLCYLIDCKLVGTTATGNAIDPAKTPQLLFGSVMA